jgi:hypothetical protein
MANQTIFKLLTVMLCRFDSERNFHIYPGERSLFLLPIHRPSTPPYRSSYASSKAPCPDTATPRSSAVHPCPARLLPPHESYNRQPSHRHRHALVRASVIFHPCLAGLAHVQRGRAVAERDFSALVEGVGTCIRRA